MLALDERDVVRRVDDLLERFGHRHRDLAASFSHHADRIENRLPADADLSEARWLFLGATFTHEYAIEATALCNPSIGPLPDQSSAAAGTLQFAMSVRGIGEGHHSSIGFRTGVIAADGAVQLEPPGPFSAIGTVEPAMFNRGLFLDRLRALGKASESASYVLGNLAPRFSAEELELQLAVLAEQRDTRRNAHATAALLRSLADRSYAVHFHPHSLLSERVLSPAMAEESHGMEDARFVRFVDDDGDATYYASYTAYDGVSTAQQLLHTSDFETFTVSPLLGPAAANKGLALFPRTVQGRYAALSRYDRETNAVAFSKTLGHWGDAVTCQLPDRDWEVIHLGNCGSPIEAKDGWLVLTHGVGPMRTYSIGPSSSTSTTPPRCSPRSTSHCSPPTPMNRTATCRTSCTPVEGSSTGTRWWCRTGSPTARSASPRSPGPTYGTR